MDIGHESFNQFNASLPGVYLGYICERWGYVDSKGSKCLNFRFKTVICKFLKNYKFQNFENRYFSNFQ